MLGFFTICLIAVSLSMDTFSLSLIYGTLGLDKKKIFILSMIVGIYHFVMPMLGNLIGYQVLNKLPFSPKLVVGVIFILIAIQMLMQTDDILDLRKIRSFFLFGLTVSLDSFSVGIGISEITSNFIFAYLTFAFVSALFTFMGLRFGNVLSDKFGNGATKLGATVLFILGVFYMFK